MLAKIDSINALHALISARNSLRDLNDQLESALRDRDENIRARATQLVRNAQGDAIRAYSAEDRILNPELQRLQMLADSTLLKSERALGALAGAKEVAIETAQGMWSALAAANTLLDASFGDAQGQKDVLAAGKTLLALADPEILRRVIDTAIDRHRENIAAAYVRGDAQELGRLDVKTLANLPLPGPAALATVQKLESVGNAADVAANLTRTAADGRSAAELATHTKAFPDHTSGPVYKKGTFEQVRADQDLFIERITELKQKLFELPDDSMESIGKRGIRGRLMMRFQATLPEVERLKADMKIPEPHVDAKKTPAEIVAIEAQEHMLRAEKTPEIRNGALVLMEGGVDQHLDVYKARQRVDAAMEGLWPKDLPAESRAQAPVLFRSDKLANVYHTINPTGDPINCVSCADALADSINGIPVSANRFNTSLAHQLDNEIFIKAYDVPEENIFTDFAQVEQRLLEWGDGAHAIVAGKRGEDVSGHNFNVVNDAGTVRWLDRHVDNHNPPRRLGFVELAIRRMDAPETARAAELGESRAEGIREIKSAVVKWVQDFADQIYPVPVPRDVRVMAMKPTALPPVSPEEVARIAAAYEAQRAEGREIFDVVHEINPGQAIDETRKINCFNCALATAATQYGHPTSALPVTFGRGLKPDEMVAYFQAESGPKLGYVGILDAMLDLPDNTLGYVYARDDGPAHIFNVAKFDGRVVVEDHQVTPAPKITVTRNNYMEALSKIYHQLDSRSQGLSVTPFFGFADNVRFRMTIPDISSGASPDRITKTQMEMTRETLRAYPPGRGISDPVPLQSSYGEAPGGQANRGLDQPLPERGTTHIQIAKSYPSESPGASLRKDAVLEGALKVLEDVEARVEASGKTHAERMSMIAQAREMVARDIRAGNFPSVTQESGVRSPDLDHHSDLGSER